MCIVLCVSDGPIRELKTRGKKKKKKKEQNISLVFDAKHLSQSLNNSSQKCNGGRTLKYCMYGRLKK